MISSRRASVKQTSADSRRDKELKFQCLGPPYQDRLSPELERILGRENAVRRWNCYWHFTGRGSEPRGSLGFGAGAARRRIVDRPKLAERGGFEPPIRLPVYTLSKRAPSATRPPLRRVGTGSRKPAHYSHRVLPCKGGPGAPGGAPFRAVDAANGCGQMAG